MLDTDRKPPIDPVGEAAASASPAPYVEVPCTCPQGHDHDTVYMAPVLTTPMGMAMAATLGPPPYTNAHVQAALVEAALAPPPTGGIIRWTKTDAKDEPEPITYESLARLLPFDQGGMEVAERATELYAETYLRPLLRRLGLSLPPTPTEPLTSPSNGSGKRHRKRSRPSSLNGSAGTP